jgi:transcription initiation factor TFIID subunit 6
LGAGHWLAIEGVQPAIVQNPTPADLKSSDQTTTSSSVGGGSSSSLAASSGTDGVETKAQIKHVLSKELQLYFEKVVNALTNEETESIRETAIASLRNDRGLHQLVPYLVAFVAEKVLSPNHIHFCQSVWGPLLILDYAQFKEHFDFECYVARHLGSPR